MRNLIWIGAILLVVGAAGSGIHLIDNNTASEPVVEAGMAPMPVQASPKATAPQQRRHTALDLEVSAGALLLGLCLMAAGRKARA